MKKLLLVLFTTCSSMVFGGQHSGLGGGAPPAPRAPEKPDSGSMYDVYKRWLQEQINAALEEKNKHCEKK